MTRRRGFRSEAGKRLGKGGGASGSGASGGGGGRRPKRDFAAKKTALPAASRERVATVIALALVIAAAASAGIVMLSLGGKAFHYVDPSRFPVKSIEVDGLKVLDRDEILGAAGVRLGQPTTSVRLEEVKAAIAKNPRVRSVRVEKHLPHRLVIEIEERVPEGLVQKDGVIMGLDADGAIFPLVTAKESVKAPIITGREGMESAELMKEALEEIALLRPDLVEKMSELRVDLVSGLTLITTGDPVVIRLGRGELKAKTEKLRSVMKQLEERGIRKEHIDLRFKDVITSP